MKNTLVSLATATTIVVGSALIAPSAEAITITLDRTQYDVTTRVGTYTELESLLESQPWFGAPVILEDAARQVGGELGFTSPLFAFQEDLGGFFFLGVFVLPDPFAEDGISFSSRPLGRDVRFGFAIAEEVEEVPEPLTILGTITFGGFMMAMKKCRNQ